MIRKMLKGEKIERLNCAMCSDALLLLLLSRFSRVQLFATSWTVAHQAPLSMGFPRHEYWSRLPFPPPGDRFEPGIKPRSPTLQVDFHH